MKEDKPKKERADKYETKVAVKGTLEDIIAAAFKPKKKVEQEENKKKA